MQAMRIFELGQALTLTQAEIPDPGPGEILLRVLACGVNFADTLMVQGKYQEKPDPPFTPGMEICGVIEALGEGVSGPAVGTRVASYAGSGGFAEYATVPAASCIAVPDMMPDEEVAGFLIAYGPEKMAIAKAAGATHVFDNDDDIRKEVKALGGADVLYDPVGGDLFEAAMRACNPLARILPLGFASGKVPQIPANILLVKNLTVHGLYWGAYAKLNPRILTDSFARLFEWYSDGALKPHISHVVPLNEAEHALDLLRTRKATGKVVVQVTEN